MSDHTAEKSGDDQTNIVVAHLSPTVSDSTFSVARSPTPIESSFYVPMSTLTAERSDTNQAISVVARLSSTVPDPTSSVAHSLALMAEYLIEELLVQIFGIVTTTDSSQLRTLSQVCRRWRNIILSSPLLWITMLDLGTSPEWVCEVFKRIDTVPFDLYIGEPHFKPSKYLIMNSLMAMQQHLHGCRFLEIELCADEIGQVLDSLDLHEPSLPLLQRVSIVNLLIYRHYEIQGSFLSIQVPNLRQLYLEGCSFDWWTFVHGNMFTSSCLSVLHLMDLGEDCMPTVSEFVSMLASAPTLHEVEIRNALGFGGRESDTESMQTLQLANLVTLRIADHIGLCTVLLRAITAPSLAHLTVRAIATTNSLEDLIGPFVDSVPTFSEKQVETVAVFYEDQMVTVHAAASGRTVNIWENRFLSITVHWDLPSDVVANGALSGPCLSRAAGALLGMPFLHTATHLQAIPDPVMVDVSPDMWCQILHSFVAVTTLELGPYSSHLLTDLYFDAVQARILVDHNWAIQLPSLRTISIPRLRVLLHMVAMIGCLRIRAGFTSLETIRSTPCEIRGMLHPDPRVPF